MATRLLILGGYGNTGQALSRLLLQETDAQLVLAGRNFEKAATFVAALANQFERDRVSCLRVDAANTDSLNHAFGQVDCVIVASSTAAYTKTIAEAAIRAQIDYFDFQVSHAKLEILRSLCEQIEQAGCCFITDCGFHPGLPAALVRYANLQFDRLEIANVGSVFKLNWKSLEFSDSTISEMVELINHFQSLYFEDGRWIFGRYSDTKCFNFEMEFGKQSCVPMMLEEMRTIPELIPSLQETGFFVGGFNWFVDYVVLPLGAIALQTHSEFATKLIGYLMSWGLKTFSYPPYRTILQLEAQGWQGRERKTLEMRISHEDGYVLTAVPAVACFLQYLDHLGQKPGLWWQAHFVEPKRFLFDIQRLGVSIQIAIGACYV